MTPDPNPSAEDVIRPHAYDGIQEYDKRLPNWWLATLYGGIVHAILYWMYFAHSGLAQSDAARVTAEMQGIEAARLSSSAGNLDDDGLWTMSRNPLLIAAGERTFVSTCASCHNEKLTGGIGPNLIDRTWLHGGRPTEVYTTVTMGSAAKGMPTWGPLLGPKKISEVVAYILSKHERNEPEMIPGSATPVAPAHPVIP